MLILLLTLWFIRGLPEPRSTEKTGPPVTQSRVEPFRGQARTIGVRWFEIWQPKAR